MPTAFVLVTFICIIRFEKEGILKIKPRTIQRRYFQCNKNYHI